MPDRVRITDVAPRDGLQNEPGVIPTADKVRLVGLLCRTGVDEVEVTSFVSPKWVPQLGDAAEVLRGVRDAGAPRSPPAFSVLIPNAQGMRAAMEAHESIAAIDKVAVFTAASETFNRRNTNATIAESVARFREVVGMARSARGEVAVRGYISCAVACPYEGPIDPEKVAAVAESLAELGVDELDLGDTIGAGTPETVGAVLKAVRRRLGPEWAGGYRTTLHLHDTFGRAADCVRAALGLGVRSFDGSVAGLGGCPYASAGGERAPGNISTETLIRVVHEAGFATGVDLERLMEAAAFAREIVGRARLGAGAQERGA